MWHLAIVWMQENVHVCKSVHDAHVVNQCEHRNHYMSFPTYFPPFYYSVWFSVSRHMMSLCPVKPNQWLLQLDNLVLIDKIKEQLMAEKIRPPHLPPTTVPSQQTLLLASSPSDGGQHVMSIPKLQQVPGLQAHNSSQPDIALHARPASSTIAGTDSPSMCYHDGVQMFCFQYALYILVLHVVMYYVGQQCNANF